MIVYVYDKNTKEYLYSQAAQKNPKRPTEYLMPACSTTEQLPVYDKSFEALVFNNHWEVKPDNRGKEVLNLNTMQFEKVDYLGDIKKGYDLISDEVREDYSQHPECYKVDTKNNKLVDIRGTQEFAARLENEFSRCFIDTFLGCVRIETKWGNFLSIKPNYDAQVLQLGYLPENVLILYKKPDFSKFENYSEVEKWLVDKGQFKNKRINSDDYTLFSQMILNRFVSEV